MKTLLLGLLLFLSSSAYAECHSWETPPERGQLYMYVVLEPCAEIKDRQHLIITRYYPEHPEFHYEHNGWWDVTCESLKEWLSQGSVVIYAPGGLKSCPKVKHILDVP